MKKISYLIISFLVLLTLVSCESTKMQKKPTTNPVYVTNTKTVYLLDPSNMDGVEDSYQLLNGTFGDTSFTLLCYFYSDENGIDISLLNDFGTDMGNLTYNGETVVFHSEVFPENLKAEYILLDIQNAYYTYDSLVKAYAAVGLKFEQEIKDDSIIRIVKNGNKIIEMITKNRNFIKIENHIRGYEYNLTAGEE